MRRINLPYFDERCATIDMIVIHCLAHDAQSAIDSFHRHQVSSHYLIDENGKIYQLVDDKKRAWHAGVSFWKGQENLNHSSIGIELCSKSLGQESYPDSQISALIRLCQRLKRKYHIKKECILGHSDIAPTRKPDPGKAFPWYYLKRHGLGVWYKLKNASQIKENDVSKMLSTIGYDTSNIEAAKWAFMRHFMPQKILQDTVQNLLSKPYPEDLKTGDDFLIVLRAVYFEMLKK